MLHNANTEEVFSIKDDVVDPTGQSNLRGKSYEVRMDHGKLEVHVRWRDRILTVDVYKLDDHLMVHLFCPKCENALRVLSKNKRIRFCEGDRRIDIERMACTYPQCGWTVVIEGNRAKDV